MAILDDGELAVGATTATDDSSFDRALGLRQLPHLLGRVLEPYLRTGATGWLVADEAPWRGAVPGSSSTVYAAAAAPYEASGPDGLTIRRIGAADADRWAEVNAAAFEMPEPEAAVWRRLTPQLIDAPGEQLFLAELDGVPVATSALYTRRRVALLAAGAVLPAFRGRGIQRALIADRIGRALEGHAMALLATAVPGSPSSRNLEAAGFERVWDRRLWRFDPVADRDVALAAAEQAAAG
jgi:GNAT superfamily N-acetyltransferase